MNAPLERYIFIKSTTKGHLGRMVHRYWLDLVEADLLKYRMPDCLNPGMVDVHRMLTYKKAYFLICYDQLHFRICGECMLTDVNGLSTQVHFSIHPKYHGKESYKIGQAGARHIFSMTKKGEQMFTTLIGVIPVVNKLARRWTEKVGYTYKTTLTNVMKCGYADGGSIQDGAVYQLVDGDI